MSNRYLASRRKRALDVAVAAHRLRARRPAAGARRAGDPAREPRAPDLPPAPRRPRRRAVRALQAAHDGHRRRDHGRRAGRRRRRRPDHPRRRAAAPRPRSTSCPTWSTCCAGRCRSSARARPCRSRSTATPSASAAGSTRARASPAGRRSTAAPRCPGTSGSSSTSTYLEHASLRLDLRILAASVRMVLTGHGLYRGETGGWREPPRRNAGERQPRLGGRRGAVRSGHSARERWMSRAEIELSTARRDWAPQWCGHPHCTDSASPVLYRFS